MKTINHFFLALALVMIPAATLATETESEQASIFEELVELYDNSEAQTVYFRFERRFIFARKKHLIIEGVCYSSYAPNTPIQTPLLVERVKEGELCTSHGSLYPDRPDYCKSDIKYRINKGILSMVEEGDDGVSGPYYKLINHNNAKYFLERNKNNSSVSRICYYEVD